MKSAISCVTPPTRAEHERALRAFLREHPAQRGLPWVFAYGSLLWHPAFPELARVPARVHGWHRALNVLAIAARGTPQRPGLWFGLERGGSVHGMLIRPHADTAAALLDLWERELPDDGYVPRWVRATPVKGKACWAIAMVGNPASRLYVGGLTVDECAARVREAKGYRGSNAEYVLNTAQHLHELQLHDARLRKVCARLG